MRSFLFLFTLLIFSITSNAQKLHVVSKNETLYSLSKKYNISIKKLIDINPECNSGLRQGMNLVIPIQYENIDTVVYSMHRVRPLESFYSIKNKFGVSQQDLLKLNPQLNDGFRAGKYIKIPKLDEPSFVTEEIKDNTKDNYNEYNFKKNGKNFKKKDFYNIAFLLPLYYQINDSLKLSSNFTEFPEIYQKSIYALDFYAGAKIAIDSLSKIHKNINIHVFDTENSTKKTFEIVSDKKFLDFDLVIGPFYSSNFKVAARVLNRKKIPLISPFSTKSDLLRDLPNTFQTLTSQKRQLTFLSEYIFKHYKNNNITLIRRKNDDFNLRDWFISSFNFDSIYFKEIIVESNVIDSIHHEIDTLCENTIIVSSKEIDFVTDILTKLNAIRDSKITVFGLSNWYLFENLDINYLMNLNVHIPNTGMISYNDTLTKYFESKFFTNYKSSPSIRFAYSGFDVTFYFLSNLIENGGVSNLNYLEPMNLTSNNFDFNYIRNYEHGSRNQFVQIIKYEDFEIKKIK